MSARSILTGEPIAFDERLPSTDPQDPLYRLRVTQDYPGDLITIAEESLTSTAVTAEAVGIRGALDLTTWQAEWVWLTLGRVLGKAPPGAPRSDTEPGGPGFTFDLDGEEVEPESDGDRQARPPTLHPEAWAY